MVTLPDRGDPTLSIALPVYNGERYLEMAIESILAQSFDDFELIITDNASTDGTEAICRSFAARDARIRYERNPANIGINKNFDLGLTLARGRYFKWAAHDDIVAPDFAGRCVELLDADLDTALVQSLVAIIDAEGSTIATYDSKLTGSDDDDPAVRFRALVLNRHICTEVFGVFRTETLRRTPGLSHPYHGVDRALLAEIALLGKIRQIPEVLFFNREHPNRYVRAVRPSERARFHQSKHRSKTELSHLAQRRDMRRAIREHIDDRATRRRCRRILARWWLVDYNALRVGVEFAAKVAPSFYDWSKRMNDRFLKPEHPTIHTQRKANEPTRR